MITWSMIKKIKNRLFERIMLSQIWKRVLKEVIKPVKQNTYDTKKRWKK